MAGFCLLVSYWIKPTKPDVASQAATQSEPPKPAKAEEIADKGAKRSSAPAGATDIAYLEILKVVFDPNGPTEMYVDFRISNPGDPTILRNWNLSILQGSKKLSNLAPRVVQTNKLLTRPLGGIKHDDLPEEPLEKGGQRTGRLTYTFKDRIPEKDFGSEGTRFDLSADDIRGRKIKAKYAL